MNGEIGISYYLKYIKLTTGSVTRGRADLLLLKYLHAGQFRE